MTLVHGETREKAKYRFLRCNPEGNTWHDLWPDIRLHRLPEWDDKPFVDCSDIRMLFDNDDYDENGDLRYDDPFVNDCDCELCKGIRG